MTEFADCLNQILKERNMNSAQAAQMCGLDTSVVFRWLRGKSLPKNWRRLEIAVEKLRLTSYETAALERAYRKALLGETQSSCFDEILKTLRILAEKRLEYTQKQESGVCRSVFPGGEALCGFRKLNHRMDIIQCIQRAFLLLQEGESLYLKMRCLPEWLMMQLKQFWNQAENPAKMLICGNGRDGIFRTAETKLSLLRQVIDLLIVKNSFEIYFYNGLDELGQTGQSWIVSERFVIQFSEDLSQGMMTQDKEWIAFLRKAFCRIQEKSRHFCKYSKEVLDFLGEEEALVGQQAAALEFMPCISLGLTDEILQDAIFPELPDKQEVIRGILEYPNNGPRMQSFDSFFSKEGLYCFMETGFVDTFPYQVYKLLTLAQRCEVLGNIIRLLEGNPQIHYFLLKEEFSDTRKICLEQRRKDRDELRFYLDFEEGKKEEIYIEDRDIKEAYFGFFQYLKESRFVYGEEETMEVMKGVLGEYR